MKVQFCFDILSVISGIFQSMTLPWINFVLNKTSWDGSQLLQKMMLMLVSEILFPPFVVLGTIRLYLCKKISFSGY